jgi:hypothetical protein
MAPFAKRTQRSDPLNMDTNLVHQGLGADRDEQGALTGGSVAKLDEFSRQQRDGKLAIVAGVSPGELTADQVRQIMTDNVNTISGRTVYPELESYLATMSGRSTLTEEKVSGPSEQVTRMVGGQTPLTVRWDPTDSLRHRRLESLITAIVKVQESGFTVPPLTAYFPKYGRNLVLSPEGVTEPGRRYHRAEYIAPDALLMSPEVLDNPLATRYAEEYHNLSTQLDPSGVGTMVHELGHFLHYHQNSARFHDLFLAEYTGGHTNVANTVSGYAAQSPREFIAEVFLGMVYGKTFPPDVMEMYEGLGGPSRDQAPTA